MSRTPLIAYVGNDPKVNLLFKESDYHLLNEGDPAQIDYEQMARVVPDLVVIDHDPHAKDGLGLIKKLRDLQPDLFLPVVCVTDETSPIFRAKCRDLGADEIMSRPVNPMEFLSALRSLVRKRHSFATLRRQLTHAQSKADHLHEANGATQKQKVGLADDLLKAEQVKQFFRNINLLDLQKVYQRIKEQLPTLLGVELFSLFVYNPDKGSLELAIHNHLNLSNQLVLLPKKGGMMFEAVKEHGSIVIGDASSKRSTGGLREKYKHGDALLVPLKIGGEVIGVLNLNNSHNGNFSEQDRLLADQVAQFLSTIICNARLYQKVRALSMIDGLTGIMNHLHLHKRLYVELLRALRYSRPLSCIMLDLDHFKIINDTYGHQAGDRILREVVEIIQAQVRELDVPARYGGEEFFIILPETGLDEALNVAERLREAVAQHGFFAEGNVIRVTASFGVASFPQAKIMHKNELIRHADQALYQAKHDGRNRVVAYQERRIANRYKVDMDIKYVTQDVRSVKGAILNNISSTGTRVASQEPIAPGTNVWLELTFAQGLPFKGGELAPGAVSQQPGQMRAQGEVVWCRASNEVSGMYEIGIRFKNLEDDKRKALTKIVYTALFRDVSQGFKSPLL